MATNLDVKVGQPVTSIWVSSEGEPMHCGVTGGWVQNLKASYLPCFLQCAMVGSAIGQCDGHTIPGPDPPLHTGENMAGMKA